MTASFVRVALPRPVDETFHYRVPADLAGRIHPGVVVVAPFGRRVLTGVVVETAESSPVEARPLLGLAEVPPVDKRLIELARWVASYYLSPVGLLLRLALPPGSTEPGLRFRLTAIGREAKGGGPFAEVLAALARGPRTASHIQGKVARGMLEGAIEAGLVEESSPSPPAAAALAPGGYRRRELAVVNLTAAQKAAVEALGCALSEDRFSVTLLQGVTGSGKTEVYLRAARQALSHGRQVLVLVPEISLTPLLTSRFATAAPGSLTVIHSALTAAERRSAWRGIQAGSARLVVGVRSAVFAPLRDLGLIIVDEEHDPSFRQEETPSYSARDVAIKRGQIEKVPVLLGSATPSLETFTNARAGRYAIAVLPERATPSPLPEAVTVDLTDPAERVPESPFLSATLVRELKETAGRGEQALLFLNRRGYAPFVLCEECGEAVTCPSCAVTLTLHRRKGMLCHYCGHRQDPPQSCPSCRGTRLLSVGMGTQRLEETLASMLPGVTVERLDRDVLERRGALEDVIRRMDEGKVQVLVGTQVVAKGHDFPGVTLVGVLNAEQALDFPDFRSAERTFQLITQVAGRAGRGKKPGRVVVQSYMPGHYAVTAALAQDYEAFYRAESEIRRALGYPPFGRLGRVLVDGVSEERVRRACEEVARALPKGSGLRVMGPSPAPLSRVQARYRWHVLILARSHKTLREALLAARTHEFTGVRVFVRVDPYHLM